MQIGKWMIPCVIRHFAKLNDTIRRSCTILSFFLSSVHSLVKAGNHVTDTSKKILTKLLRIGTMNPCNIYLFKINNRNTFWCLHCYCLILNICSTWIHCFYGFLGTLYLHAVICSYITILWGGMTEEFSSMYLWSKETKVKNYGPFLKIAPLKI